MNERVRGVRVTRKGQRKRPRVGRRIGEREGKGKRDARMGLVSLRGVSYRPPLGSAYHEHEPSVLPFPPAPLLVLSFSLSPSHEHLCSLPVALRPNFPRSLTPYFLPNPAECKQRGPPGNLHLITTITTGDFHDTTSGPSLPAPCSLPFSLSPHHLTDFAWSSPKADTRYCLPYTIRSPFLCMCAVR